jgi:starch synthase
MNEDRSNPRILIVTPEISYLPKGMGTLSNGFSAKAGGLADVSAALISALFEQGADVHVALYQIAISGWTHHNLKPCVTICIRSF